MVGELICKIKLDYLFLKTLNPKHELLKYFVLDEQGFNISQRDEIIEEFLEKFRGDMLPAEVAKSRRIPFIIYEYMLTSSVFGNYVNSLENAIQFAEMMN
jgi:hypothetical protein